MLTLRRINKQRIQLIKQPLQNALIQFQQNLNVYFCLYNLKDSFKDGFYFGLLQLHQNYPFAAPKLYFYTPNGRYQINMPICTSFTNYHQQSWISSWTVRTLIQATISFMYDHEPSYGCRADSDQIKFQLSKLSLSFNLKLSKFRQLFQQQIINKVQQFQSKGLNVQHIKQCLENCKPQQKQIYLLNDQSYLRQSLLNSEQFEQQNQIQTQKRRNQIILNKKKKIKKYLYIGGVVLIVLIIGCICIF